MRTSIFPSLFRDSEPYREEASEPRVYYQTVNYKLSVLMEVLGEDWESAQYVKLIGILSSVQEKIFERCRIEIPTGRIIANVRFEGSYWIEYGPGKKIGFTQGDVLAILNLLTQPTLKVKLTIVDPPAESSSFHDPDGGVVRPVVPVISLEKEFNTVELLDLLLIQEIIELKEFRERQQHGKEKIGLLHSESEILIERYINSLV